MTTATGTGLTPYTSGQAEEYQARLVMTPEDAKALEEQVRRCTAAVLREGTDYGVIPGTNGEKTLWRPGAQKLLQWFGLECTCERVEVERDDQGRKHGITYRAEVGRGLKTATPVILATCEGTADYDEPKFYQSAEQVQRKAEDRERAWAARDGRPARPTKWQGLPEYRADWNALMKRAQKRAIVGAVNDATAAGGIFSDREEDDSPAPQGDGPTWYEQALEQALSFTDVEDGRALYVGASQAHLDGLCTGRQKDHIQNRVQQRVRKLKAVTPVDVEDLARQAGRASQAPGENEPDPTRPAGPAATGTATGSSTAPAADTPSDPENQPGTAIQAQLNRMHAILTGLGFGNDDRAAKLRIAEVITGRTLTGPRDGRSSANLSYTEAERLIAKLDGFTDENGERDRAALVAFMAQHEQGDDAL